MGLFGKDRIFFGSTYVQMIAPHYVNLDKGCAQVMLPIPGGKRKPGPLTVFSTASKAGNGDPNGKNGVIFRASSGFIIYEFDYAFDPRAKGFPYHSTPTHIESGGYFANCLLELEKPYILVGANGEISESYVVACTDDETQKDAALVVNFLLADGETTKFDMTVQELYAFYQSTDEVSKYIISPNGELFSDLLSYGKNPQQRINDVVKAKLNALNSKLSQLNTKRKSILESSEMKGVQTVVSDLTPEEYVKYFGHVMLNEDDSDIMVVNKDGEIEVLKISIAFIGKNKFSVSVTNVPVLNYTKEYLEVLALNWGADEIAEPRVPAGFSLKRAKSIRRSKKIIKDFY